MRSFEKNICCTGFFIFVLFLAPLARASDVCDALHGAKIIADDGKYLGTVDGPYGGDSIFNEYSAYGSSYSGDSIWNEYGSYGGEYSSSSPFNKYSSNPPMIIKNRKIIAFLTVNDSIDGAVNPIKLGVVCYDVVMRR
ncbi:hypothetical protein [Thalassobaculum sp.]|uniref:hypothetical protein n=1 Tax=Thalassobaculum sp. TaxID=2022740 RepID=UPI003B5CB908